MTVILPITVFIDGDKITVDMGSIPNTLTNVVGESYRLDFSHRGLSQPVIAVVYQDGISITGSHNPPIGFLIKPGQSFTIDTWFNELIGDAGLVFGELPLMAMVQLPDGNGSVTIKLHMTADDPKSPARLLLKRDSDSSVGFGRWSKDAAFVMDHSVRITEMPFFIHTIRYT